MEALMPDVENMGFGNDTNTNDTTNQDNNNDTQNTDENITE